MRPWCAAAGKDGKLWVSGNPGLYLLTGLPGSIAVKKVLSTPTTPVVTAMASFDGRVCHALGDELYAIDGEEIRPMTELEPTLCGHEIRSVHISPKGYLAVAAIDGLLVARLDGGGRASDIHWFDSRSGFTTIKPLMGSMAETEDGTIWLAGLEDMISFSPANLLTDNQLSTVIPTPRPWWQRPWALLIFAGVLSLGIWLLARRSAHRQAGRKMPEKLLFKSVNTKLFLEADDIAGFKADGNYANLISFDGEYLVLENLLSLERRLKGWGHFVRVDRSTMINIVKVRSIDQQQHSCTLKSNDGRRLEIPLSISGISALSDALESIRTSS